ncbi:dynein regulatory complex protein 12 isoform X6 [Mobula birostris]|uniref:dynein regulatory complex protein 12 isoform X6 n=1 Tax=Mobula birostris TaxID=1983395 RepID=UPI003B2802AE
MKPPAFLRGHPEEEERGPRRDNRKGGEVRMRISWLLDLPRKMPPKNKGKAKKGKKKATKGDNVEEKYKQTVHQVESLKNQLVLRRDIARQALLVKEEWKAKLQVLKNDLKEEQAIKKSIHSDMTRQYKTMRSELDLRVHQLEIEVGHLQQQLTASEDTGGESASHQGERFYHQRAPDEN